ncbi:MAG: UDP-N-acetylmuramoyl-L-alanine--D-glutamate ligase [Schwartzia sp.]|nr:UDP-N-acetylmuramoyl-L-alanine--D-glutamate ligase [Schwartzia sp. (in: firmicutes)]
MDLANQNVLVVGLGISGMAAARLAKRFGAEVVVSDAKEEGKLGDEPKTLRSEGIRVVCGPQELSLLDGVDHIIVSPAVPVRIPLLQEAYRRGMDVESEVEFAYHIAKSPILAITGTNGKTTTTTLVGKLMETAFPVVGVGGNIGVPLSEECLRVGGGGCVVAEISSYQMEATDDFVPHVAAVLNVTPDHVVRHGTLEVYQQMKEKLFAQQTEKDFLVLNYDDPKTRDMAKRAPGTVCFFSRSELLGEGAFVKDGTLTMRWDGKEIPVLPVNDLQIRGGHNVENALAAMAMAYLAGAEPNKIAAVLRAFTGVEHRIEAVLSCDGVSYWNDSKATNTDSAIKALESFTEPIVLLAGGDDKMTDLTEFMRLVKEKCRALVLGGNAAARFKEAAVAADFPRDKIFEAGYSMEKGVELARAAAQPGDAVLLSPACASFDMYSGFEERGRNFKDIVRRMAGRK